jgi:hypothetical protein
MLLSMVLLITFLSWNVDATRTLNFSSKKKHGQKDTTDSQPNAFMTMINNRFGKNSTNITGNDAILFVEGMLSGMFN